jgi:hypothetical protein
MTDDTPKGALILHAIVSVQFSVTSGSVTVKNRHLWCWTVGF